MLIFHSATSTQPCSSVAQALLPALRREGPVLPSSGCRQQILAPSPSRYTEETPSPAETLAAGHFLCFSPCLCASVAPLTSSAETPAAPNRSPGSTLPAVRNARPCAPCIHPNIQAA